MLLEIGEPFQRILHEPVRFVPLTRMRKPVPVAIALPGERLESDGMGAANDDWAKASCIATTANTIAPIRESVRDFKGYMTEHHS